MEIHCYEPHAGLATLWFYDAYDPGHTEPAEDPRALRLVGPTSIGECETVKKVLTLVLARLRIEVAFEVGADD
jgi:hypothetical protein